MEHEARNINVIEHIARYCVLAAAAIDRFGDSQEIFKRDTDYQHCCAMYIFQIGELSTHLSEDFRKAYPDIPWRAMRDMRNLFAHEYLRVDIDIVWETMIKRLPELYEKCCEILRQYAVLNGTVFTPEDDEDDWKPEL
jgi:uncharacterized protein with HEPN domain